MERYRVVDDKTGKVLLDTDVSPVDINIWNYAERAIKANPGSDIFIEFYDDGHFEHYVDSEAILHDNEMKRRGLV